MDEVIVTDDILSCIPPNIGYFKDLFDGMLVDDIKAELTTIESAIVEMKEIIMLYDQGAYYVKEIDV